MRRYRRDVGLGLRTASQPSAKTARRGVAATHPTTMRWTSIIVGLALTSMIAGLVVSLLLD